MRRLPNLHVKGESAVLQDRAIPGSLITLFTDHVCMQLTKYTINSFFRKIQLAPNIRETPLFAGIGHCPYFPQQLKLLSYHGTVLSIKS